MEKPTEFEIGNYPPPAYTSPHTSHIDSSKPSIPPLYPAPSVMSSVTSQPQPAYRPPLRRTNASDNIHNIHTDPLHLEPLRRNKCMYIITIWLTNAPFLIMFVMDMVGIATPKSAYYRDIICNNNMWPVQMIVCFVTGAIINVIWLSSTLPKTQEQWQRQVDSPCCVWRSIYWALKVIVCCVGVWSWPFISDRIHQSVEPTYPSCAERGFNSSVLFSVVPETKNARWRGSWGVGNVTLESGDDVFGLNLEPVRDLGKFLLTVDENVTSLGLLQRVRGTTVMLDIAAGSYELRRGGVPEGSRKNGTMTDMRKLYLSFPSMGIRSVAGVDWSHFDKRPEVMLVDDKRVVLISVEKHPKDRQDVMFRMCTPWSVQKIVEDGDAMEKVLVPLTRVGIGMAIWAGEH